MVFCQTYTQVLGKTQLWPSWAPHSIPRSTQLHVSCAQTRETHPEPSSLTGLGHFNNPQSWLSGKFWPSPRQAAGCAQISPRRWDDPAGDEVIYPAQEEQRPPMPPAHPQLWFLYGHSLAQQCQAESSFAPGTQGSVTGHRIPGASCGFRALAAEPLPNAQTVTKENNPFWQQGMRKIKLSLTGWFLKQIFSKEEENSAGFQKHKLKWLTENFPLLYFQPILFFVMSIPELNGYLLSWILY